MSHHLLRHADLVVSMDDDHAEWPNTDLRLRDGQIAEIGQKLTPDGAELHDLTGCLVTPGLVNTHHHLFQTMTRAVPAAQDAKLFGWLESLYPIWARMGPEHIRVSALTGLAELALSGCTMTADHQYLFPNGARLDDAIDAAGQAGLRFHATRGAMSIGRSAGGLPPDALVEDPDAILSDTIRVIDLHHDPAPGAMLRVGVAPCSPFSVSRELMRDAALLARDKNVRLHTHLAENDEDVRFSMARFGCSPAQYAEDLGWTGDDVWHAHCVKLEPNDLRLFARTGTGVAHCPCSNCRLGSGIAPVAAMMSAGVPVGLGVDGSASNDNSNMVAEARQAMLLQRVSSGADAMSARGALRLATRGGARLLGRDDCGQIAPGLRADLAVWDLSEVEAAGSWDAAALLLAGPTRVRHLFVEGRQIVRDGTLTTIDLPRVLEDQNRLARALANSG